MPQTISLLGRCLGPWVCGAVTAAPGLHEVEAVDPGGGDKKNAVRGWLLAFVAALLLFSATAGRGVQWQDSGLHILRIVTGESINSLGLALSHPLHHWLGRFVVWWGLIEPCHAITLISAFAGAIAVANVYGCVLTATRCPSAAAFAAASLGLAHTFWKMATITETYTLAAALFAGECWCLVAFGKSGRRRALWGMALLNGLGIANHMLASLTIPVLAAVIVTGALGKTIRGKDVVIAVTCWLVGALPYVWIVAAELMHGGALLPTIGSALFGKSFGGHVLRVWPTSRHLLIGFAFVGLNFPNLLLPAAALGILRAKRLGVASITSRAWLAAICLHAIFVFRYTVVDHYMFFLPLYVLLCLFGGLGYASMMREPHGARRGRTLWIAVVLLALTPALYAAAPTIARHFNVLDDVARSKPYRDDYAYLLTPWSVAERSAERMAREAVALAGSDGLIVARDPMAAFALRYEAIQKGLPALPIEPDVTVERVLAAVREGRRVVLVPLDRDEPGADPPGGSWKRIGDLYVLHVR